MTKTLYDPKVKKKGIEKGIEKGLEEGQRKAKIEVAKNMIENGLDTELIIKITEISKEEVIKLRK